MHGMYRWILLRPWRRMAALFLCCLLFTTLWAQAGQAQLADRMVRLHVVANSDSESDQTLKLQVRDRLLPILSDCVRSCATRQEAAQRIRAAIPRLTALAETALREQGCEDSVAISLGQVWYPTRETNGMTLPAGVYHALRVVIGAGEGHNWWCVVFPALSLPAVTQTAVPAMGLSGADYALVTAETPVYRLKLRSAELFGEFLHRIAPDASCEGQKAVID